MRTCAQLWTTVFNKPGSQSQELTRQRIVQEERCGRRPATTIPGPQFDELVRGPSGETLRDPWASTQMRHSIQPPLVGYGGTVPRVRPEHTGVNKGEQAAQFVPHYGSKAYLAAKREAPAGGSSALGTKPFAVPGTRSKPRLPSLAQIRSACTRGPLAAMLLCTLTMVTDFACAQHLRDGASTTA